MRNRGPKTKRADGGFTLIELVVAIAVLGIIMPVITATFVVIVRNSPAVQTRTDDSRSTRGLSTWLPQDVLSTPPVVITDGSSTPGYTLTARASDCASTAGTNVLHMVWQENVGPNAATLTNFVANYRYVIVGATTQIKRYTCSGIGPLQYTNTQVRNATTALDGSSVGAVAVYSGARLAFVDVQVVTASGLQVLIRAASRNPAKVLGP